MQFTFLYVIYRRILVLLKLSIYTLWFSPLLSFIVNLIMLFLDFNKYCKNDLNKVANPEIIQIHFINVEYFGNMRDCSWMIFSFTIYSNYIVGVQLQYTSDMWCSCFRIGSLLIIVFCTLKNKLSTNIVSSKWRKCNMNHLNVLDVCF